MTFEELTKPTIPGVKGRRISFNIMEEAGYVSPPVVFERDAQGNPLASARFVMGADPYESYDPDFTFELNGRVYSIDEDKAATIEIKAAIEQAVKLPYFPGKNPASFTLLTGRQGMAEFDKALRSSL